jgi:hypothetical protein
MMVYLSFISPPKIRRDILMDINLNKIGLLKVKKDICTTNINQKAFIYGIYVIIGKKHQFNAILMI